MSTNLHIDDIGNLILRDGKLGLFVSSQNVTPPHYGGGRVGALCPYAYCAGDPVNLVDPTGMKPEDFYNMNGNFAGSNGVNDGKKSIIINKYDAKKAKKNAKKTGVVGGVAIAVPVPSNAQIDAAQECIDKGQETGKEHGFVMGEGGAASDVIAGEPGSVNLGPGYNQPSEGKISPQSDAHYHGYVFWVDDKGNTHSYTTQPSNNEDGTGDIPLRKSREESVLLIHPIGLWVKSLEPQLI